MELTRYNKAIFGRIDANQDTQEIYRQIQGEEGEQIVQQMLDKELKLNYVHNIELNIKNQIQLDFLIVDDDKMINLEVKHYKGDYYIIDNQMKNSYGNIFQTPFSQMKRAEYELELIKSHLNIKRDIISYLVFTNPTFTLHSDIPNRKQVLLPTELHKIPRLFNNFKVDENRAILNKIKTLKQDFSKTYPRHMIPFEQIKPGLRCPHCRKINQIQLDKRMRFGHCMYCSRQIQRQLLYLENLKELYVLKNEPFTLKEAKLWCGGDAHAIRRVCKRHFKKKGKHKSYFYL